MTTRSEEDYRRTYNKKYPEKVGFARTRNGIVLAKTQAEADVAAYRVDLVDSQEALLGRSL